MATYNFIDLIGQKFGRWDVITRVFNPAKRKNSKWLCRCSCGKEKIVSGYSLRKGQSKSCGCLQKEIGSELNGAKLTGQTFNKLLVVKKVPPPSSIKSKGRQQLLYWLCKCECGNTIILSSSSLLSRKALSCGCYRKNQTTPIYKDEHYLNLSIFRPMWYKIQDSYRASKKSKSEFTCNITIQELKEVWDKQQGICPYTKIKLKLPKQKDNTKTDYHFASVDRRDSSKGYFKGNIQFVAWPVNFAKSNCHEQLLIDFLKEVAKNLNAPINK